MSEKEIEIPIDELTDLSVQEHPPIPDELLELIPEEYRQDPSQMSDSQKEALQDAILGREDGKDLLDLLQDADILSFTKELAKDIGGEGFDTDQLNNSAHLRENFTQMKKELGEDASKPEKIAEMANQIDVDEVMALPHVQAAMQKQGVSRQQAEAIIQSGNFHRFLAATNSAIQKINAPCSECSKKSKNAYKREDLPFCSKKCQKAYFKK